MRTIICGSRTIVGSELLAYAMERLFWPIKEVLSGGALGADTVGEAWAKLNGRRVTRYLPDWNQYGKRAGLVRNARMVEDAGAIIAMWNGISKGTIHTLTLAQEKGLPGIAVAYAEGRPYLVRWWF